jgi:alpha-galactosidase
MERKKIVVIGAGSASFGLSTLAGLIRNPDLHGCRLSLVDIDEEGVGAISRLAERLNREWQADMAIDSTVDRRKALPGADYVILSIATDRENRWRIDHELAKEFGIMHYAENGGPGALFHTARNLALVMPILGDMERLCPRARLLNFTNPVPRIALAARRYSRISTVGICHQLSFGYMMAGYVLAKDLGIDAPDDYRFVWTDKAGEIERHIVAQAKEKLDITAAGINHFTWMIDVSTKQGEDIYPLLKKRFLEAPRDFEPLTRQMLEIFDCVPVPGDCHLCEYLPYTHNMQKDTWKKFDIQMYDLKRGADNREKLWKRIMLMGSGELDVDDLKNAHTERAELIIGAALSNSHAYEPAVNLPNQGYVANLPADSIVEVPAIVSSSGIRGLGMGLLPEPVAELCRRQIAVAELAVKAGVEGSRTAALQALALDPMIDDPSLASRLFDRYLEAHRGFLPQFA